MNGNLSSRSGLSLSRSRTGLVVTISAKDGGGARSLCVGDGLEAASGVVDNNK